MMIAERAAAAIQPDGGGILKASQVPMAARIAVVTMVTMAAPVSNRAGLNRMIYDGSDIGGFVKTEVTLTRVEAWI